MLTSVTTRTRPWMLPSRSGSPRRHLPDKNSGLVSRLLKRLRIHGLIKKVGNTYKYYLTQFGKDVIATGLKFRELVLIPPLACGQAG